MKDGKVHYVGGLGKHPETGVYVYRFCRRARIYTGSTDTTRYQDAVDYFLKLKSDLAFEKIGLKKKPPKLITVLQAFESWKKVCGPLLSPKYVANVSMSFKHHVLPFIGGRQITEVDKFMVAELRNRLVERGRAKSYAQTLGLQIGAVLTYAKEKGWITERPTICNVKFQRKSRPVITKANLVEFLAEVDSKGHLDFSFLVRVMLYMGLRSEEAIKMKWACYHSSSRTYLADLTKNKEASSMPIPAPMLEWFEKVKAERLKQEVVSPWICPSPRDPAKPRAKNSVSDMLDQVAEKMKLGRLTRHRLRASFCTILHQDGVAIKKIQKLMRHSRVETTMNYIEVEDSELQEAVDDVFAS